MMKIYIASPFFNDEEFERVNKMEKFLEDRGYSVYSPKRDGIILRPDSSPEDRLMTYKDNIKNVMECDLMIAIVATKDTGTSVELGVKIGQWETIKNMTEMIRKEDPEVLNIYDRQILAQSTPRIISFSDNGKPLNVMLLGGVLKHCMSWEELSSYLDYVDSVGLQNAVRDFSEAGNVPVY